MYSCLCADSVAVHSVEVELAQLNAQHVDLELLLDVELVGEQHVGEIWSLRAAARDLYDVFPGLHSWGGRECGAASISESDRTDPVSGI